MKEKKIRDLKKVIKREKTFSTEAKSEGKGAATRAKEEAKAGLKESAMDSRWETKVDETFSKIRKKKAAKETRKLDKIDERNS
jgi:hypothetical protein